MTLREKQSKFVWMIGQLIDFAYKNGYQLTFGEAWRTDEQAEINAVGAGARIRIASAIEDRGFPRLADKIRNNRGNGIRNSLHEYRLAIDFNLFKEGRWLRNTEDHRPLGEFWESIGGTWGGRFGDGNHYSLEHNGRK